MEILNFMNNHSDWENIITQPPYSITVKCDGKYILLKYSQFSSDFNNSMVRECRGTIFYKNYNGKYICVRRAFDKFGNYGESYAPDIDWNNVSVEEKVDGSLISLWYHNKSWHISTNGTIDAFKAQINDKNINFGQLVYEAFDGRENFNKFCSHLYKDFTYTFELVSPKSKMTIFYPKTKLYYLGQRNIITMKESKDYMPFMKDFGVLCPKIYPLNTIEDCLEYVKNMTKDQESFVIRDKNFNRIKLKSPEYLFAFHCNNNGIITTKRIIDMIKEEKIDDFLTYCPQYVEQVEDVKNKIQKLVGHLDFVWKAVSVAQYLNKKEFAIFIDKFLDKDFLFRKYNNHNLNTVDYIMSKPTNQIKEMIEGV